MKLIKFLMCFLVVGVISGCNNNNDKITLDIMFAPSKNPEDITKGVEPLKAILTNELTNRGYNIEAINLSVGDSYEVVGEALASGSVDVGFIPAGTYIKYKPEGVEVLLAALHPSVSINSEDPKVWNENKPTTITGDGASSYQSIIVVGPSSKGQELANKINNNQELTWEDLNSATWCTSSPTSSSGYLYPSLWLKDNYNKEIQDLENTVRIKGYGDSVNSLKSQVCDISVGYGDFRYDYQDSWQGSIWEETNVIGVSSLIPYDTISVSQNSKDLSDKLNQDLKEIFINLKDTPQGLEVMKTFSHTGYVTPNLEEYEQERRVIEELTPQA